MAITELQPCAMFAKGPPCTNAGAPPSVWTRFGASASRSRAAMAPSALSSRAVTGFCVRDQPITMSPMRRLRSAHDSVRQKIAISSDATTMSNPSSRG